jgi:CheY-like chemotaxis protein
MLKNNPVELIFADAKQVETNESLFKDIATHQTNLGHRIVVMFPTQLTLERVGTMFKLGAHDCVDKLYDPAGLLDVINNQVGQRQPGILIVEDDPDWQRRLVHYIKNKGYHIETASTPDDALTQMEKFSVDLVILDLRLIDESEDFQGIEVLNLIRRQFPEVAIIIVSAYGTVEHMRTGYKVYNIYDYFEKQTFDPDLYHQAVSGVLAKQKRITSR